MDTSNPIIGFGRLQKKVLFRADRVVIHVDIKENQLKNGYLSKNFTTKYGQNQLFSRFIPSDILIYMYVTLVISWIQKQQID